MPGKPQWQHGHSINFLVPCYNMPLHCMRDTATVEPPGARALQTLPMLQAGVRAPRQGQRKLISGSHSDTRQEHVLSKKHLRAVDNLRT